jgi:hypothetical protein
MPVRLDHDAVQRVVRRAIELERTPVDDDGLDVDTVIAAAAEAGIDAAAVRESIAWERLGPRPERARLDRLVGQSSVIVERTIRAPVGEVLEQLDAWLTVGHHLRREHAERTSFGELDGATVEWIKRGDLAASVQRSVRSVAGGAGLGSVRCVHGELVAVDATRSVVRLRIDRRFGRTASLATSGTVGAASVAGGAAAATVVMAPFAVVALPGLVVAGGTAAVSRRRAGTLERELRRLLDQIDAGERPATIVVGVARRLGLRRA